MPSSVNEHATAEIWPALLAMRRFAVANGRSRAGVVRFAHRGGRWQFDADAGAETGGHSDVELVIALDGASDRSRGASATIAYHHERWCRGETPWEGAVERIDAGALAAFRLYLPALVGAIRARDAGELFVTAHLAQTIDGRIACATGHSQWISNDDNLRHSHRLRALHDAVAVGRRTVEADDPRLTVRHVAGEQPRRVVLNGSAELLGAASRYRVFDDPGCVVVCRQGAEPLRRARLDGSSVEVAELGTNGNGLVAPDTIAGYLVGRGWSTLFLEGGGTSLSLFLAAHRVDLLHVHVAPRILGSGVHAFTLPEVAAIQESQHFHVTHFSLGGELLLECRAPSTAA